MNFIPVATSVGGTYDENIPEATVVSVVTAEKLRFDAAVLKNNGKYKEAFEKLALANELDRNNKKPSEPTIPSAPPMPPPPLPPRRSRQQPIPSAPPMPPPPLPPRSSSQQPKPPVEYDSEYDSDDEKPIFSLTEHGVGNTGVRDSNNALGDTFTTQGRSNKI